MTVNELIEKLKEMPGDAPVFATWEGIFRCVAVYKAGKGEVIIDADSEHYRERIEKQEESAGPCFCQRCGEEERRRREGDG